MRLKRDLPIAGLALVLLVCAAGYYGTRDNAPPRTGKRAVAESPAVDEQLLKTARQLAPLADTSEEQDQAREALRLADHELDLAFAGALREAAAPDAAAAAATGPLQELSARIAALKAKLAAGQDRVAQLTSLAGKDTDAADRLEFAKAQMELDQDDLDDAQQDLARQGGNRHDRLERALQRHEATQQGATPLTKPSPQAPAGTLKEQAQQWSALNARHLALVAAQQQASVKVPELEGRHNTLEAKTAGAAVPPADTDAGMADLRALSRQKKTLTEFDKRIQDLQQLAATYTAWIAVVETRQRAALHLLLRSLAIIFAIALALVLAHRLTLHAFRAYDRRKRHLVEVASEIACQLVGVIAILLIIFGPPNQISTVLGLATAGLTVVLKDFIVGFIGWFVLMGRNGVRIGDWVEINGVGGEVIEIGVLKTSLLEMGKSNTGHPTGRRVSFSNSYAIEGHYFNFSTVGQWLWDELHVTLPPAGEPYRMAEQIRQTVERETAEASAEAEQDWQRVTHEYGVPAFSAKPAVDLRPAVNGLEVVVRYITRAPLRYEVKSRLFQAIVALLHGA